MSNLRPVIVELESGAVIQIVARLAQELLAGLINADAHQLVGLVLLVLLDQFNVLAAGAVAVFTLHTFEMRRLLSVHETSVVTQDVRSTPTNGVTTNALGVVDSRNTQASGLQAFERVRVLALVPLRESLRVTLATLFSSDKLVATAVLDGQFLLGQLRVLQQVSQTPNPKPQTPALKGGSKVELLKGFKFELSELEFI